MYSVRRLTLCKLIATLLYITTQQLNNVISSTHQQQTPAENQQPPTLSTTVHSTSATNQSSSQTRRLMQYDDLPVGDQANPNFFLDTHSDPHTTTDNQSLFRVPLVREPILDPIDPPGGGSGVGADKLNSSWSGPTFPEVEATTSAPLSNPLNGSDDAIKQAIGQTAKTNSNKSSSNNNKQQFIHLKPTLYPLNLTNPTKHFNTNLLNSLSTPSSHQPLRYMVNREPQPHLRPAASSTAGLPPQLALHSVKRLPRPKHRFRFIPLAPNVHRPQVVRPRQANRWPREHYLAVRRPPPPPPPLLSTTLGSKIWNLLYPQWFKETPGGPDIATLNWPFPAQVIKKRPRGKLSAPAALAHEQQVPLGLAQSASHMNSYTVEPAVDTELGGEFISPHQEQPVAFHLGQEEPAAAEFPVQLGPAGFGLDGDPLASADYPVTLAGDTSGADQQALLLSTLMKPGQQKQKHKKRRKKIVKLPAHHQFGTSYLDFVNPEPQVVGAEPEPSASSEQHAASEAGVGSEEQVMDEGDAKKSRPQAAETDDTTDRRKPARTPHLQSSVVPRQKRARHPKRAHKNLQNFYDYGPAGGDLQPSGTFHRWKYPYLYNNDNDNDEEGETEVNIRLFNNFSRVGPLAGLGRYAATGTLIISLVLLIISNICMLSTYVVHGLSALSTVYGLPSIATASAPLASPSVASNKNVTSLSYTNWDSLLPPSLVRRKQTTTTTTPAPNLAARSLMSLAHHQHQPPSMTFDSEIKSFGDPWK